MLSYDRKSLELVDQLPLKDLILEDKTGKSAKIKATPQPSKEVKVVPLSPDDQSKTVLCYQKFAKEFTIKIIATVLPHQDNLKSFIRTHTNTMSREPEPLPSHQPTHRRI